MEDLYDFFRLRMVEALHKDTLDSFRVRANNALTILDELSLLLKAWIGGNIKRFETVESCISEAKGLIYSDDCLQYTYPILDKGMFVEELNDYVSSVRKDKVLSVEKTQQMLFLVNQVFCTNDSSYLEACVSRIENIIKRNEALNDENFIPKLDELDFYITSFCCELLRIGYSKAHLYKFFKDIKQGRGKETFDATFQQIRETLLNKKLRKHQVIFRLDFLNKGYSKCATANMSQLQETIPQNLQRNKSVLKRYKVVNEYVRYYIGEKKALDPGSAVRKCYENLSNDSDFNLESVHEVKMPSTALVVDGSNVHLEKVYYMDACESPVFSATHKLGDVVSGLRQAKGVSKDALDRFFSALRHLRIGDQQTEVEQRFINYWIAIEFIFASVHSGESTFERIKAFLPKILECCYIKRNILYMENWLRCKKKLCNGQSLLSLTEEERKKLETDVDILTRYRLRRIKSHLHHSDKIKEYLRRHRTNIERHLIRIYRLRNELVHEAAIKQDIASVTSNVRYYLVFVLNRLIGFLKEGGASPGEKEMFHFFWVYDSVLKMIERTNYDIEQIMAVPLEGNYIT